MEENRMDIAVGLLLAATVGGIISIWADITLLSQICMGTIFLEYLALSGHGWPRINIFVLPGFIVTKGSERAPKSRSNKLKTANCYSH